MNEALEGIIIGETSYGETSKIINILTKKYGIIGVMAKGCKSMKSPLRSLTNKLTYATFNIYYKNDKMSTLKDATIINGFFKIKTDINKISYASFILELASQVSKQNYDENVYDLLTASLIKIEEGFDPLVITNILELKYLEYLGVMPVMDACSMCGSNTGIITLSPSAGGYICKNCYTNDKMVSTKTIKMLRMLYYVDISKISKLEISSDVKREINAFLDDYYDRYTGLYLKSKSFIQNLNKISV